jgi:ribonuclease HI
MPAGRLVGSGGKPLTNLDLIIDLFKAVHARTGRVVWVYSPGHKNIIGNIKADSLAVAGVSKAY